MIMPRSKDLARSNLVYVTVYFREDEKRLVDEAARRETRTISNLMRSVVLEYIKRQSTNLVHDNMKQEI
jgi:hypothetical protein